MTTTRDIDRVLDRWFEGEDRVPERVIERALENIDHIPQRRATRVPRRLTDMPTSLRLLGLAAALAVMGGATYLLAGAIRQSDDVGTPRQILDSAGTWTASRPAAFGRPAGRYEFDTYSDLVARGPDGTDIPLGPVISDDGATAVIGQIPDCPGQATYGYSLSPDLLTLTARALDDPCADRRTLIEGTWARTRSDVGLQQRVAYTVDMTGLQVRLRIPDWPGIVGDGPYGLTQGPTGLAPRELRIGTDRPGVAETDYELRLVVDPRLARDVCDVRKGILPAGWTLDDFADPTRGGSSATVSHRVDTTVAGYPAVQVTIEPGASCVVGPFSEAECCPEDMAWGRHLRSWGVLVGDRRVLLQFYRTDEPLTEEQLAIGEQLIESLVLTPLTR
jgi:hypothetical protein